MLFSRVVITALLLSTLLLALVGLVLLVGIGWGEVQPRYQVAYYSVDDRGRGAIMLHDTTAGLALPIHHTPHPVVSMAWSPDGEQLAFSAYADLTYRTNLLDLNTLTVRRLSDLTGSNRPLIWGPGGSNVIFQQRVGPDIHLYNTDLTTGQSTRLLPDITINGDLSYTADGAHVALTITRQGGGDIYTGPCLDCPLQRRTGNPDEDFRPAWSPDGAWLALLSNRSGRYEAYVMAAACPDMACAVQVSDEGTLPTSLSWSPDSRWLIYEVGPVNLIGSELYVVDMTCPPGDCRQRITPPGEYSSSVDWSTDSRWLVYLGRRINSSTLVLKSADCLTCDGLRLVHSADRLLAPAWRPGISPRSSN